MPPFSPRKRRLSILPLEGRLVLELFCSEGTALSSSTSVNGFQTHRVLEAAMCISPQLGGDDLVHPILTGFGLCVDPAPSSTIVGWT